MCVYRVFSFHSNGPCRPDRRYFWWRRHPDVVTCSCNCKAVQDSLLMTEYWLPATLPPLSPPPPPPPPPPPYKAALKRTWFCYCITYKTQHGIFESLPVLCTQKTDAAEHRNYLTLFLSCDNPECVFFQCFFFFSLFFVVVIVVFLVGVL